MDNYKPVMISILVFLKHNKNVFLFFLENMPEKPLEFDRMHKNKKIFLEFFEISKRNQIFLILDPYLTVSVYSLILGKIIKKTHEKPINNLKMIPKFFLTILESVWLNSKIMTNKI